MLGGIKGVDIFEYRKLFFPVNEDWSHWVLIEADFVAKSMWVLDPFSEISDPKESLIQYVRKYIDDERRDKKGAAFSPEYWSEWEFKAVDHTLPYQTNGELKAASVFLS